MKIIFIRTTEPISTKLGPNYPWIFYNEGPALFQGEIIIK